LYSSLENSPAQKNMQADWVDSNTETFMENIFVLFLLTLSLTMVPFYLTNGFRVAVRLFSDGSQMTSEYGENENVEHEPLAECLTDVPTTI